MVLCATLHLGPCLLLFSLTSCNSPSRGALCEPRKSVQDSSPGILRRVSSGVTGVASDVSKGDGGFVFPQIYLYDCTEVSPYCLLFFGGDISIQKDKDQDTIAVDEWIVFQSPARIAHLVKVTPFNSVSGEP